MTANASEVADVARQERAAQWLLALRAPELTEAVAAEWLEWCEADPRNRAAFEAMAELWELAGGVDPAMMAAPAVAANDEGGFGAKSWLGWAGAAAALMLAIVGAWVLIRTSPLQPADQSSQVARLETPRGQVQATTLEDGSRIDLGGRTTLAVRYSPERRLIVTEGGEAFFRVARNADRPFVVDAGPVTVTAIGTAFSVQRDGNSVAVAVTEGMVEVRAAAGIRGERGSSQPVVMRVAAGHRVRFDRGEFTRSIEPIQADYVAPWREGRLEFRDEPLRLVVARINRYSPRQIEISDPSIADLRVTTTVYNDRVDAWLQGIAAVLPVRVEDGAGDRAIISPAT